MTISEASLRITKEGLRAKLPMQVLSDGDVYSARCLPLDLVAQGETREEAREAIEEAVTMFLQDLLERNMLEQGLFELGWKREMEQSVPTYQIPPAVIEELNIGPIRAAT